MNVSRRLEETLGWGSSSAAAWEEAAGVAGAAVRNPATPHHTSGSRAGLFDSPSAAARQRLKAGGPMQPQKGEHKGDVQIPEVEVGSVPANWNWSTF